MVTNSFIADAWAELSEKQDVYIASFEGVSPYLMNPAFVDIETYNGIREIESLILLFLNKEDCYDYIDMINEILDPDFQDLGIEISVMKKTLHQLYSEIEEYNVLSQQEFDCSVRIDLCKNITPKGDEGTVMGIDTLYSSYRLPV